MISETPDLALIGCGASGALLSLHLFRQADRALQITCVEPRSRLGAGLAYGSVRDEHLLNVPASRMSARADTPEHFADWLARRRLLTAAPQHHFARRRDYADYLTDSLGESLRTSRYHHGLHHEPHRAVGLHPLRGGWLVSLDDGSQIWSRNVVLALGNLPSMAPPPGLEAIVGETGYVHDPWQPDSRLPDQDEQVALIGAGLTAIDQIMSLDALGHRGHIVAISRHGLWSSTHALNGRALSFELTAASPLSLSRAVRQRIRETVQAGQAWQPVIDALRPQTSRLWEAWSEDEKGQFCRHLRSYWDRARHRMPPMVAERLDALLRSGQLSLRASRQLQASVDGARIRLDPGPEQEPILVDRVINCTGASTRIAASRQPMLEQLLEDRLISPGPQGLGLANDPDGRLTRADGLPHTGLYTLGPMRQGTLWESTAIPEIRQQASALADLLLDRL